MKFCEIWKDYEKGLWVSRKAWKKDYAIRLCNLPGEYEDVPDDFPILQQDTYGSLFNFNQIMTRKHFSHMGRGVEMVYGLQYTILADDWYVPDQAMCEVRLREADGQRRI